MSHLSLLITAELGEDSGYALAFGVSNCTKLVAGIHPDKQSRKVRYDKAYASAADRTKPCPPWGMALDFRAEQLLCGHGVEVTLNATVVKKMYAPPQTRRQRRDPRLDAQWEEHGLPLPKRQAFRTCR